MLIIKHRYHGWVQNGEEQAIHTQKIRYHAIKSLLLTFSPTRCNKYSHQSLIIALAFRQNSCLRLEASLCWVRTLPASSRDGRYWASTGYTTIITTAYKLKVSYIVIMCDKEKRKVLTLIEALFSSSWQVVCDKRAFTSGFVFETQNQAGRNQNR